MPISSLPSVGPTLPAGCTNVKVKNTGADPGGSDVTTLSDEQRIYAESPLIDAGNTTITASFILQAGAVPAVTSGLNPTGWVCTEVEIEYAVGEYAKGTANYVYVQPED